MTGRTGLRVAWLALPLLLAACGTTREGLVLDTGLVPADVLIERVSEESEKVRTLAGSGTLIFDSPRLSGAAEFTLALSKPDSLLVKLEGPFGMDVGLLFLDADGYVAYNTMQNEVMAGGADSSALRALIPVPLAPNQIVAAFVGRPPIDPEARILRYGIDDDRFLADRAVRNGHLQVLGGPRVAGGDVVPAHGARRPCSPRGRGLRT